MNLIWEGLGDPQASTDKNKSRMISRQRKKKEKKITLIWFTAPSKMPTVSSLHSISTALIDVS